MSGSDPGGSAAREDSTSEPLALVQLVWRRGGRWALLGVTLLFTSLAVLAVVHRSGEAWGDVPTWVAAVTSLLALLAAAFAGLVAYAVLDVELGRDRVAAAERAERREAEQRAQAGKVAAWYATWDGEAPFGPLAPPPSLQANQVYGAVIRNGSELPVYEIRKPGIGKATLAIHVAHKLRDEFPDGQMYANLRGGEVKAADPASVLAGFLRELDVDGRDIPEDLDERARMYRTLLAGQRVLLVLDNAVDENQVRPYVDPRHR